MFEFTETTVSHNGVVKLHFHSEPEHGTAKEFLDKIYKAQEKKPKAVVTQSGDAIMIVTPEDSTLVQAEDLT